MVLLVRDLMSRKINIVSGKATIVKAAKIMTKSRRGYVVVVKNGKPIGILTDSDIIEKVVSKNKDPSRIKVKDIMSSPVIVTYPDVKIDEASLLMRKNLVKRLPIVDRKNGKLVGILTETDIAKSVPEFISILEERISAKEEGYEPERITGVASGICEECGNYSELLSYFNGKWICESCREVETKD